MVSRMPEIQFFMHMQNFIDDIDFCYSVIAVTPEKFIRTGNFIFLIWIILMRHKA